VLTHYFSKKDDPKVYTFGFMISDEEEILIENKPSRAAFDRAAERARVLLAKSDEAIAKAKADPSLVNTLAAVTAVKLSGSAVNALADEQAAYAADAATCIARLIDG
jgi:hypothetical protein